MRLVGEEECKSTVKVCTRLIGIPKQSVLKVGAGLSMVRHRRSARSVLNIWGGNEQGKYPLALAAH